MHRTTLPSYASVVVIGGGIMGCSTLYHLAKAGISDAILLERNQLTSGTTWHSAAQVRALRSSRNLTELIRYSISLYGELEKETDQSTGWINKGSLSIATNQDRLTHIKRQESLARLFGVRAQSISAGEVKERWPLVYEGDIVGAVWSPDDGRVSPSDLCAALAKGAKARGVKIFEETAVQAIKTKGNRAVAVETNAGEIRCDAIALCTGLWSREIARRAGVGAPVWPCEHFYFLTKPIEGIRGNMPTLSDHDAHLYIRDDSGGLLVGCFEPMGKPIDPATLGEDFAFQLLPEDWDHLEPIMLNALHRLPCLEEAEIKTLLNGPESFTPDGSFLLGESAETDGFFLGCGMNSVGVATGGGAGMALAHRIAHGAMPMDLSEVDPRRFPDCLNSVRALADRVPEVLGKHYEIAYPGRQWSSSRMLETSPLHEQWLAADAHFGQFFGIERPLYFHKVSEPELGFGRPSWSDRVGEEVAYTHQHAGLFDQSSFGKIRVTGSGAERFLNRICTNDVSRKPGRAMYTLMLNDNGGIESDLTVFRLGECDYRLYVGTTEIRKDLAWLRRHLTVDDSVVLADESKDYAVIGLMGPQSAAIAREIGAADLNSLRYFQHADTDIAGIPVRACRMSYVGEAGWEITCAAEVAREIYDLLSQAGARPAGLFAQTSMRIEKRYLAYGHELDTDVTPLDAGLEFAVCWSKDFIGKDALMKQKEASPKTRIATVVLEDTNANPLGDEPVYVAGEIAGKTTSAAFGYRVGKPVSIVMLQTAADKNPKAQDVEVDVAGCRYAGAISIDPVFDPKGTRMRRSRDGNPGTGSTGSRASTGRT